MQSQRVPVQRPSKGGSKARVARAAGGRDDSKVPESSIHKEAWKINLKSQRIPVQRPAKGASMVRVRREGIPPQFLLKEKVGTPEGESKTPTYSISKQTFMANALRDGGSSAPRVARGVPVGSKQAESITPESSIQKANWKINMQSQRVPVQRLQKGGSKARVARAAGGRDDAKIPESSIHKEAWKINMKSQRVPVQRPKKQADAHV
ncbi:hypothetical protein AAVH_33703 [Aphelenchoides avenae]|nr:hypothetical protein AAVH_33703 [Aphelenchus avenae]